ncbi:hypothetical protein [Streptomyces dysideae]|uniref:Uncharacterized protein n=1 Tax=Streptomyces dysideae TaxID=909626 RepID=A0A101V144_9ACTN|nr:hypothetical protein [Streptomyces dysideae]KUO20533.1 hypothetical protein AQJ91_13905 [Streptomyces dysideae]
MGRPTPTNRTITRLLPWSGPEGKPCYLLTDDSGGGYLSRLADNIESVQLGMGSELLGHAQELLDDPKAGAGELRFLSARLTEALRDAVRVAESRVARLQLPVSDAGDEDTSGRDTDLSRTR